jgi:hypothetical protein
MYRREVTTATQNCLTNIKVPKETADVLRIYCIFNKRKVTDFATSVLDKELASFRRRLEVLKRQD